MRSTEQNARGFSLVELLIAMALGLIVLAATTQLFKSGMDATHPGHAVVRNAAERSRHAEPDRQGCEHGWLGPAFRRSGFARRRGISGLVLRGGSQPGMAGQQRLIRTSSCSALFLATSNGMELGGPATSDGHGQRRRTRSRSSTLTTLSRLISTRLRSRPRTRWETKSRSRLRRFHRRAFRPSSLPPEFRWET